jgi:outer membrane biosynthesis protein TonB
MGTWGHGLFDDDLALDVKGQFDRAVAGGARPAEVAAGLMESELSREVLEEFDSEERDDLFWEESRGLFYAIAVLQLEHGALQEVVRQQTLQAIAVERRALDPERDRERWALLDELEAKLRTGAEGAKPMSALPLEVGMAKPPKPKAKPKAKKPAAKPKPKPKAKPKKPAAKPKPKAKPKKIPARSTKRRA